MRNQLIEGIAIIERITQLKGQGDNELTEKSLKWIEKVKAKLSSLEDSQTEQQRRERKEKEEKKIEEWFRQEKQKKLCLRQERMLLKLFEGLRVQLIWQEYQNYLVEKRGGNIRKLNEEKEVELEKMREQLRRDEQEIKRLKAKKEKARVDKSFKEEENEPKR